MLPPVETPQETCNQSSHFGCQTLQHLHPNRYFRVPWLHVICDQTDVLLRQDNIKNYYYIHSKLCKVFWLLFQSPGRSAL